MPEAEGLIHLARTLIEDDPAAAARHLESLGDEEASSVLESLPPELAQAVLPRVHINRLAALLESSTPRVFETIVRSIDSRRASTAFLLLPADKRSELLTHLPKRIKSEVKERLTFPENSVGRIMLTDFLAFRKELTVKEAIRRIRRLAVKKRMPASYVYVVDGDTRLIGVVNMRDLMLAAETDTLDAVKTPGVFTLHCFMEVREAAEELARQRYFAAPVVDNEGHLLGVIQAERLLRGAQSGAAEDIQKMFGAGGDERAFSPISFSLRKRLPWLHVNLATAFLAAAVVALFEGTIAKITILAVFLPVVAGQGGNAGAQSLAIVMRGLVMREVQPDKVTALVLKEGLLGLINGAITGLATALIAWLWHGNPYLGVVVGLGMIVNLFSAGLSGAAIPVTMKKLGLDPAQCSSIILTTVTDVVGFFAFLGFAALFAEKLV